ncbi:MAG TPA: hypothetical protein VFW09_06535 [Solirubrobacteraceae bacterium]|nr:hypothetical protein [Solirubrobacteraceae bacterium]
MTDVLDRLRADNPVAAGAAPSIDRVWDRIEHGRAPGRRRTRSRWRAAAAGISIAIPLVIAALAIGVLGHHSASDSSSSSSAPARSGARAVPTLAQLLRNFAVLRRPQTAADRSWQPPNVVVNEQRLRRFTRLAQRLPNGDRIYLSIARFRNRPAGNDPLAARYMLNVDIVSANGNDGLGASFDRSVNYTVSPLSSLGLRPAAGRTPTWVSVIPDGVDRVRWRFACPPSSTAGCGRQPPVTVTVPVRGNVAAASVPATDTVCGGRVQRHCRMPVAITWYSADGRVLLRYRPLALGGFTAPPFIKAGRAAPLQPEAVAVSRVLAGDGIGDAHLGQSPERVRAVLEQMLSQRGSRYTRQPGCGIDHIIAWPSPHPHLPTAVLDAFFSHRRFVGYSYGPIAGHSAPRPAAHGIALATERGLKIGDTLARGRRLYGRSFRRSAAQGGSWSIHTATGKLDGFAYNGRDARVGPRSLVATIDAGHVGCPALSP